MEKLKIIIDAGIVVADVAIIVLLLKKRKGGK